jgi:hypothetical protein
MDKDYVTKAQAEATKLELLERIDATRLQLLERAEKVETTLLTEFRKWDRSFESRTRVTELSVAGLHERMGLIEERVSERENPSRE